MHPYPHSYRVSTAAAATGNVTVSSPGLVDLPSAPPVEFDGPGGLWSPETLLCAAVADCFILSFRAVARASKFEWTQLGCHVEGILDRADGTTRFTRYVTRVTLTVPTGTDRARAQTLLEKAEHVCLISNSLNGERELHCEIVEG
jgi:organic hydroperoxide reductase OsmC/OhrA